VIWFEKRDGYKRVVGKVLVAPPEELFCMALDCVKRIEVRLEQVRRGLAWGYKKWLGDKL
jgi:hypothetical protein